MIRTRALTDFPRNSLAHRNLKRGDRKKILIAQVIVRYDHLVIGKCNDGLSMFQIRLLGFFRCHTPVRDRRVHMHIGFICVFLCKQLLFHFCAPFIQLSNHFLLLSSENTCHTSKLYHNPPSKTIFFPKKHNLFLHFTQK